MIVDPARETTGAGTRGRARPPGVSVRGASAVLQGGGETVLVGASRREKHLLLMLNSGGV